MRKTSQRTTEEDAAHGRMAADRGRTTDGGIEKKEEGRVLQSPSKRLVLVFIFICTY